MVLLNFQQALHHFLIVIYGKHVYHASFLRYCYLWSAHMSLWQWTYIQLDYNTYNYRTYSRTYSYFCRRTKALQ